MRIPLERQSTVPLYQQIENSLRQNIQSGGLQPDTRLPSTRQLAKELGVSRITVQNAYAELESDGLIGSREGSGTYVLTPIQQPGHSKNANAEIDWPLWQENFALSNEMQASEFAIQPTQPSQHPDLISFTGVGDPTQFPIKDFQKAMQKVLRSDGIDALMYGAFDGGYLPLRETVTHVLASQGIQTHPDNVLITSGSQQALTLVCQLLLKAGDVILVEQPTYNFALSLFRSLNLKIVSVPMDNDGMQVDQLESLLQQYHPKLLYTIPNFQNPTGACLSGVRRRQLVALASKYNVPILEDDFVGDLRYDGRSQPAIKALDPNGNVIYIGTFSKMLMPGLRVGFLVANGPVFNQLMRRKFVQDLATSTLIQRTLHEYVTVGRYQTHLRRSCRRYRQRRDAMLAAIEAYLPSGVQVDTPQGGLFIWVRLPENISVTKLQPFAISQGVTFAPGPHFFPNPADGDAYLRLNFATQGIDKIDEGIKRLGAAIEHLLVRSVAKSS